MGTKWKSKIVIAAWVVMFTVGLSGILSLFTLGSNYVHRDYFHTPGFRAELDQFARYLSRYEMNSMTLEQAKKSITVTEEEINDYRNRYGSLTHQMVNIKAEYEHLIEEALAMDNEEAAEVYIAERDRRIEDITKGFKSDEYIREKVIADKEQRITEVYQEHEYYRREFLSYKESFLYYFQNSEAGIVYTNLGSSEDGSPEDNMKPSEMLFITNYFIPGEYAAYYGLPVSYESTDSLIPFEGRIAVSKSLSSSNPIMIEYDRYKQKQMIWLVYALASIGALIACFYLRISRGIPAGFDAWKPRYSKLPIDLRAILFTATGVFAVNTLYYINEQIFYDIRNPLVYSRDMVSSVLIGSIVWGLTLMQGVFLVTEFKDRNNLGKAWQKALIYRAGKGAYAIFNQTKHSLKNAFLNKSTGVQLFVILTAVFGLGLSVIMVTLDPFFLLIYLILLVIIGIPIVMMLIKSIGYFNLVLIKTNELAVGNLGQDVPVSGESVLAMLAGNINRIKQGLKTSQTEQAKSERMKTELITNVSHDLRTPLTSIITYTDLLKRETLSDKDRLGYVEIIDRKSKRLKVLIDDLFEISKMASGNVELTLEKVDLVQLLQQALAEYDIAIANSSLQFRITYAEMPVYALVDGNKLWRVYNNLIENVLKYSMENTRIYIKVCANDNQAMITFKNVSQYELSENTAELLERFKRGDTSRQTEGSGLGLAIAKSIVDLHEGRLAIETEGDLFKVSISLKQVI